MLALVTGCSRDAEVAPAAGVDANLNAGASAPGAAPTKTPSTGSAGIGSPLVRPTEELLRLVHEEPVAQIDFRDAVRVAASLQADESRMSRVGSAVNGRVTTIRAQVGDRVSQGQALASVASTDLANAQMNYLQAVAQAQFQARAVARAQLLVSADVVGSAELQRREADLASAEAAMRAGYDYLRGLGMSEAELRRLSETRRIDSTVALAAAISGTVIERKIAQGQVIAPSDSAFTIADLSTLWVVANVPEQLTRGLRVGEQVEVEVPSLGDMRIAGRLDFVAALVDPETRTVRVRMNLDNRRGDFKPAMLATMLVKGPPNHVLAVPADAVVRDGDRDHVFVRESAEGGWRMVRVRLGPENGGMRPVLEGLGKGQRIAVRGAFHIDAARKSTLGS